MPWNRSQTALWLGERAGMRTWRSPLAARASTKVPAMYSGPLSVKHRPDPDAVTAIETQGLVDEAGRHGAVGRAQHDGDDGEAGEDVDGGELVHLAHALELADVEAVEADELARATRGQAEPEGLVLARGVGHHQPVVAAAMAAARARRWARCPARWPPGAFAPSTWRSRTPGHRADRRTGDSRSSAGARPGSTGLR